MKRKYIILILALLGMLLLMGQTCATSEKTNTKESATENTEEVEEELFGENEEDINYGKNEEMTEEEIQEGDVEDDIGGADFNLIESWGRFEEKDYKFAAELLGLSADYLEGEGEDLLGKDAEHLEATMEAIEDLKEVLEDEDNLNLTQINSTFSQIGLNLTRDYLAIAVAINESPEDNEFYVSKAIDILERTILNLNETQKESVNELLQSLQVYDEKLSEGKLTKADNLQVFVDKMQQILNTQKLSF